MQIKYLPKPGRRSGSTNNIMKIAGELIDAGYKVGLIFYTDWVMRTEITGIPRKSKTFLNSEVLHGKLRGQRFDFLFIMDRAFYSDYLLDELVYSIAGSTEVLFIEELKRTERELYND